MTAITGGKVGSDAQLCRSDDAACKKVTYEWV